MNIANEMKDASIELVRGVRDALHDIVADLIGGSAVHAFTKLCVLLETVEAGYESLTEEGGEEE